MRARISKCPRNITFFPCLSSLLSVWLISDGGMLVSPSWTSASTTMAGASSQDPLQPQDLGNYRKIPSSAICPQVAMETIHRPQVQMRCSFLSRGGDTGIFPERPVSLDVSSSLLLQGLATSLEAFLLTSLLSQGRSFSWLGMGNSVFSTLSSRSFVYALNPFTCCRLGLLETKVKMACKMICAVNPDTTFPSDGWLTTCQWVTLSDWEWQKGKREMQGGKDQRSSCPEICPCSMSCMNMCTHVYVYMDMYEGVPKMS